MMNDLRFGILGCGGMGNLRARALDRTPGVTLVAAADPHAERRQSLAGRHGCAAHASAADLLADERVEAVIVATPPHLHHEHVLAALESGRPVLCEKPLATSVAACREMVLAAERRGLPLATGFNIRRFPAFARGHELLASGALGDLVFVRGFHGHAGGSEFEAKTPDGPRDGGGTLMDNGIHLLDLVRFFLGEVAEVRGLSDQSVWPFPGCEDNGFALLRSRTGKPAMLHSSWTEWRGYGFFVEAYGTNGFVRASYPPMLLTRGTAAQPGRPARVRREWFPLFQVQERLRSYRWTLECSFAAELVDFASAVRERRPPACSGRDGLAAVALADAIYRASASGETVRIGE